MCCPLGIPSHHEENKPLLSSSELGNYPLGFAQKLHFEGGHSSPFLMRCRYIKGFHPVPSVWKNPEEPDRVGNSFATIPFASGANDSGAFEDKKGRLVGDRLLQLVVH